MMALSGVRSSWDMLARNCDLCWLASRAALALLLELAGTAGRSRSPGRTGWRTSGAGRRPLGGNAPGDLARARERRRARAPRAAAARPAASGSPRCQHRADAAVVGDHRRQQVRAPGSRRARAAPPGRAVPSLRARSGPPAAPRPAPADIGACARSSNSPALARRTRRWCRRRPREPDGVRDDRRQHLLEVERGGDGLADLAERLQLARSRSCSSSNRRAFSMAITAWSANVSSSAISRSVNG